MDARLAAAVLLAGAAVATPYPDLTGDVKRGPDLAGVQVSNDRSTVTFRIRFASAPPLRATAKTVDMLLVGIDVPPTGALPRAPGGEWRGANFAAGTHGPSRTGMLVKLRTGKKSTLVTRFAVRTKGATVSFTLPRRALGNPAWLTFSVAAAREGGNEGDGFDVVPDRGTARYALR